MITITKQSTSVLFEFDENQHYLYNGSIEIPYNTLSIISDQSDMITLKKAYSNDIFLSARFEDFGYASKEAALEGLQDDLFAETGGGGGGSGMTSGQVQTMIEANLEDYYDKDEIDSGFSDVYGVVGLKANEDDLTAHTANTVIHVSSAQTAAWDAKQDALVSGTNIKTINNESILGSGNITIQGGGGSGMTSGEVQTMIDASISGKTDDTDFTAHTANTTAHTTSQEKAAWDAKANMVTLAQAEYDALVSAGTVDSGTCYIISDATAFDPATKQDVLSAGTGIEISSANVISCTVTGGVSSAQVQTMINQSVSGKQETLVSGTNIKTINNESILGSGNITIQGGGGSGATYSAGTNISIDTANTINCTLPIVRGQFVSSSSEGTCYGIRLGVTGVTSSESSFCGRACVIEGGNSRAGDSNNGWAHAEGWNNNAWANYSHVEGSNNKAYGNSSHVEGHNNDMGGYRDATDAAHVEGRYNKVNNPAEHASGQYNKSLSASTTWGDSGNTLFSVGNGSSTANTHNAFEIRQNGDIYCSNGTSDVKLQDYLQVKVVKISQSDYDALVQGGTVQNDTLYVITNVVS